MKTDYYREGWKPLPGGGYEFEHVKALPDPERGPQHLGVSLGTECGQCRAWARIFPTLAEMVAAAGAIHVVQITEHADDPLAARLVLGLRGYMLDAMDAETREDQGMEYVGQLAADCRRAWLRVHDR